MTPRLPTASPDENDDARPANDARALCPYDALDAWWRAVNESTRPDTFAARRCVPSADEDEP